MFYSVSTWACQLWSWKDQYTSCPFPTEMWCSLSRALISSAYPFEFFISIFWNIALFSIDCKISQHSSRSTIFKLSSWNWLSYYLNFQWSFKFKWLTIWACSKFLIQTPQTTDWNICLARQSYSGILFWIFALRLPLFI